MKKRTRESILASKLSEELDSGKPNINNIIDIFDNCSVIDIKTLNKLKLKKKIDIKRISGGLKQCIHSHGPIYLKDIPSAAKRIYGALLINEVEVHNNRFKDIFIGFLIGFIVVYFLG
jgi:hypothetical protein